MFQNQNSEIGSKIPGFNQVIREMRLELNLLIT